MTIPAETSWCRTCGNPVGPERKCGCWAHVADALQRYLGMDFDGSAQTASELWDQTDDEDRQRVWSAEYAGDHTVETYPAPVCPPHLAAWNHKDCPGTFAFRERLPTATVFACGTCGQRRVAQDDPAASDAAMAALAGHLADAATGDPCADIRDEDLHEHLTGAHQWEGDDIDPGDIDVLRAMHRAVMDNTAKGGDPR